MEQYFGPKIFNCEIEKCLTDCTCQDTVNMYLENLYFLPNYLFCFVSYLSKKRKLFAINLMIFDRNLEIRMKW